MAKRRKQKEFMDKGKGIKYIIWPCLIVMVGSLIYLVWFVNNQNATYNHILYIQSFMTNSGKLNDFQNKLGMHDPETDIKWYKTDDEIRIEFGYITLTWEPKDFFQQENLELLQTIGFTTEIVTDDEGNKILKLYYMGEELERWIK